MRRYLKFLLILIGTSWVFSSCTVNSYMMFRTTKSTKDLIIVDSIPLAPTEAYRLAVDDLFTMEFYVEDGKRLIDMTAGVFDVTDTRRGGSGSTSTSYLIRSNGKAELPILGLVKLEGLTIVEAQEYLKTLYSELYIDPFIQLHVTNKKVIVFSGGGGNAKIINLRHENTTLMEVLAQAGGISTRGKAKNIKIMRKTPSGREIYQVDLSTLEGLIYADMIVQSNDFIYVQPTRQIARELLQDISPIMSLVSVAMAIITLILKIK